MPTLTQWNFSWGFFLRYPIFRPTPPGWVRLREDQSHWLMPQDKNVGLAASHKLILKLIPLTIQTIHIPLESTWHEHPVGKPLFVGLEDPRYIPDIPGSLLHWNPGVSGGSQLSEFWGRCFQGTEPATQATWGFAQKWIDMRDRDPESIWVLSSQDFWSEVAWPNWQTLEVLRFNAASYSEQGFRATMEVAWSRLVSVGLGWSRLVRGRGVGFGDGNGVLVSDG